MSDTNNIVVIVHDHWFESGQGTAFGQGTQTGYDLEIVCGTFYDPEYGQGSSSAHFGSVHAEFNEIVLKKDIL